MPSSPPSATLLLGGADVRRLVDMRECIAVMRETMQGVSRGEARLPLRIGAFSPDGRSAYVAMPAALASPRAGGAKLLSISLPGAGAPRRSHQGVVVLFDADTGAPSAIVDAHAITALRTAAASAVATDALARPDADSLAVLGTGEQARAHLEALALVRPLRRIRLWGRSAEHAAACARDATHRLGIAVEVADTVRDAVRGAAIIATTTGATEPILFGDWVEAGAHVNLVGACSAQEREVDDALVLRSRFYVDYRPSALAQAGELLQTLGARAGEFIVGEIGEVLAGSAPGRSGDTEVTMYRSLGIAAQDLALASAAAARARATGIGGVFDF